MTTRSGPRVAGLAALVFLIAASTVLVYGTSSSAAGPAHPALVPGPLSLPSTVLVTAPPSGSTGPDDITELAVAGVDHGRPVIWTAYQNGINPDGTPGKIGGATASTVVGYDRLTGAVVRTIAVTGKADGLTADPALGTLIATVNEDDHSALNLIYPSLGAVATYAYSPDPAVGGNGGTDSIAVLGGHIYLAHSNPNDTSQAAEYSVILHRTTLVAQLTPVFFDDSVATDVLSGAPATLGLTDPDTNFAMPRVSPHFAGTLATIGQADGKVVFASHLGRSVHLSVLNLTDNVTGNVPPIDGFAVASCGKGTLYVVDAHAGSISALRTDGWPAGTVFVGEPSDNGNPLVGTLDLNSGHITPLGNHFASPKGLLFLPNGCGASGHGHHAAGGHDHDGRGLGVGSRPQDDL